MNINDTQQENNRAPVVTFSNIALDDEPSSGPVGYDHLPAEAMEPQPITVVDIQFKKGGKVYYFDPGRLTVSAGDEVIIDTARGPEYGFCARGNHAVDGDKVVSPLRPVLRVATDADKRTRAEYKRREESAFSTCQQKILDHKLDMKLVSAEYSFDGSKILFYFTADGRVDFRELVKDLAGVFRTRIELRQIGVRDEAKLLGGLGICGRPFCCKQFLDDFQPVSIKMAKTQNLSLNPTKISGTCGRLMCCLKYEQDAYEALLKTSPKTDSLVNTCDGMGTVTDTNLLQQTVKVRLNSDPGTIKCYQNCDICVLRNGKAKKNDPPIPEDLPPLPRREEAAPEPEEPIAMFDESFLSNYTGEETREPRKRPAKPEKSDRPQDSRSQRRNGSRGKISNKSQNRSADSKKARQKADGQAKESAPAKDSASREGGNGKPRSRRRSRGGKKPSAGGQNQNQNQPQTQNRE